MIRGNLSAVKDGNVEDLKKTQYTLIFPNPEVVLEAYLHMESPLVADEPPTVTDFASNFAPN